MKKLTKVLEKELRELTKDTVIDKENDIIIGDVGLGDKTDAKSE